MAFEYAPPLRPLRGTRPALLATAGLLSAAPSLLSGARLRKIRNRGGRVGRGGSDVGDARGVDLGVGDGGDGVGGVGGVVGGVVGVSGGVDVDVDVGVVGGDGALWTERWAWRRWHTPRSAIPGGGGNGRGGCCFALLESPVAAAAAAAAVTVAIAVGLALCAPSSSTVAFAGGHGLRCPTDEAAVATTTAMAGAAPRGSSAVEPVENVTKVTGVLTEIVGSLEFGGEM